ncbi:MAG TPA: serine hydrolase domain-containing protein, partial [Vicinamibacterales bacterium]|nr:serine hydrolase domain-containing protein [Vicinamibacterales bacterium]
MSALSTAPTATLLTCLLALGIVPASAQTRTDADAIDRFVAAEMADQQIPGVAVAIVRGGAVMKARGYGYANVEHEVPVTRETIFQ